MQITDEMVERACEAFSKADVIYPNGGERTQLTDWFKLDAQDALDFCVLKAAKWDSNSDIRAMQHEWYVAAVAKEPMRAALSAVMHAQVSVKPLEWHKSHITSWNEDWHTTTPFIYTVRCADENGWKWSFNSGYGYAPTPEAAKADAQADYSARIISALSVSPAPVDGGEPTPQNPSPSTHVKGDNEEKALQAVVDEMQMQHGSANTIRQQARNIIKAYRASLATEGK